MPTKAVSLFGRASLADILERLSLCMGFKKGKYGVVDDHLREPKAISPFQIIIEWC
jgi:hypothetical protein